MKRISLLVLFCVCGLCLLQAQSLAGKTVYASVKDGKLKSSTWFFAGTTGTFVYGDQFTVLGEKGSWVQLRGTNNVTGWTSASSVTTRQIISTGNRTSASAEELALAGKAYSAEVEKVYQDSSQVDFSAVDLMESIVVSDEEVLQFIQDGKLNTGEEE
jgi:hypothetical protein